MAKWDFVITQAVYKFVTFIYFILSLYTGTAVTSENIQDLEIQNK